MPAFDPTPLLPTGPDETPYRLVTADGVSTTTALGREFLTVEPEALRLLARTAVRDVSHLLELGMEAVWRIEVEDFPAFVVVDDKGHHFFAPKDTSVPVTIGWRPAEA